jgi:hypothetical protein
MATKGIEWPGYKGESRVFSGVPGVYGPGVVVPLDSTGMTEGEAREAIKGTPLKLVDIKAKGGAA